MCACLFYSLDFRQMHLEARPVSGLILRVPSSRAVHFEYLSMTIMYVDHLEPEIWVFVCAFDLVYDHTIPFIINSCVFLCLGPWGIAHHFVLMQLYGRRV